MSMVICPNCGGEVDREAAKCPYCGYINMEGAEKKFRADIAEIKADTAREKKKPAKAFRGGLSSGGKVILTTLIVLLVLGITYAAIVAFELRNHPKEFLSADDEAFASAYKVVAGEQLAAAYDNKDIAQLAQIFDKAYSEDRVSLWGDPHYETGYAASCYMKLQQCLPNLDKEKLKTKEAEEITYYCFYFYYRAYGEDGAAIFDEIREKEILPILENRLGFTGEDMENFRAKVTSGTGVVRSYVHSAAKKYYKNYH